MRTGFYDLLIKMHLESYVMSRTLTKFEYVVPLTEKLDENHLENYQKLMNNGILPKKEDFVSVRPAIAKAEDIKNESQRTLLVPPAISLHKIKCFVMNSLVESIKISAGHVRDPVGGSNANLFV